MTTHDPKAVMWLEACELLNQAERLHRQFFQLGRTRRQQPSWEPPLDLIETERDIIVLVALPGVDPKDVQVIVAGGTLSVIGERRVPEEYRRAVFHRIEIPNGRFERRVLLPPGQYEIERREVVDGCLFLRLAKR